MTDPEPFETNSLRFSDTPRGSPKVIKADRSPARSIRAEMEPPRDIFKSSLDMDSSDDEQQPMTVRPADLTQKRNAHPSHRDTGDGDVGPLLAAGGQPESSHHVKPEDFRLSRLSDGHADMTSVGSSFDGSVTEMALDDNSQHQPAIMNRLRHKGHLPTSTAEPALEEDQKPILADADRSKNILEAHKLTLLALQQNGDGKNMTPPPLQVYRDDPHIPKQSTTIASGADSQISSKAVRKVAVLTPAIDIHRARSWKGSKPIPSPYPITRNRPIREQLASPRSDHSLSLRDSTLHLRLHRRHRGRPAQTATIFIPPALVADYSTIKTAPQKEKEKHFRSLDYDDSAIALALRKAYATLLPLPYRLFAARSLVRITVSGPASKAADRAYGWLHPAAAAAAAAQTTSRLSSDRERRRSPSASGYEIAPSVVSFSPGRRGAAAGGGGLGGFSEEKLLRLFRKPSSVRSRYAWVGWARKIADAEEDVVVDVAERVNALTGQMEELFRGLAEAVRSGAATAESGGEGLSPWSSRVPSLAVPGQGQGHRPGHQRASSARSWPGENRAQPVSPAPLGVSAGPAKLRSRERNCEEEDFEGLVFVLGWDVGRIVAFLALVLLLAVAAVLVWIFFGPRNGAEFLIRTAVVQEGRERGFGSVRGAGDRVGAGLVLGICTLLVGLTGFGAWLGVSWLVV